LLAPAGLLARGLMYIVIGWIALQVAFGKSGQQADRSGALHALGGTPFGAVALWVLVIGFFGMALWQLSEALFGSPSGGQQAGTRLRALARGLIYGILGYGVLEYAIGAGGQQSSDQQRVSRRGRGHDAAAAGQGTRLRAALARGDAGRPLAAGSRRDRAHHFRRVLVLRGPLGAGRETYVHNVRRI